MTPLRLLTLALALAAIAPATAAAAPASSAAQSRAVTFSVRNVNASKLACPTDGRTYSVRGHLVGTAAALAKPRAVTLYLHGLGFGEFFWDFSAVKGYDYAAAMAAKGDVSVVVDRLGYKASGKPEGMNTCFGGQADIAHQIVGKLRSGAYATGTGKAATTRGPRFSKVVLAGHSAGGLTTELEATSFGDVDAIVVMAYADQGLSDVGRMAASANAIDCGRGGTRAFGDRGPFGYAFFGRTDADARAGFFASAPEDVIAATLGLRSRDGCGDTATYLAAGGVNLTNLGSITVPVLLVGADKDALYPPPSIAQQATLYTGSHAFSLATLPNSAHAVTLEADHVALADDVHAFLARNGL